MKKKTKLVGVKFDRKTNDKNDKIYYYKTNKDIKKGDTVEIKVPTGGTPDALVVDVKEYSGGNYKKL